MQDIVLARHQEMYLKRTISGEVLCKQAKQGAETFSTNHLQLSLRAVIQKLKQMAQDFKTIKRMSDQHNTIDSKRVAKSELT